MTNNLRELSRLPVGAIGNLTLEQETIKFIYEDLNDIKHKFVDIGFRLKEANNLRYYARLGYDSIEALAEDLFDMKKSSVYSLIGICENFCNETMHLLPEYEKFTQSQLVEMLSMYFGHRKYITADMTIDEIREFKKAIRFNGGCVIVGLSARQQIDRYHEKQNGGAVSEQEFRRAMKGIDGILGKVQTSGKKTYVSPEIKIEIDKPEEAETLESDIYGEEGFVQGGDLDDDDIVGKISEQSDESSGDEKSYVRNSPKTGKLTFKNNDARRVWFENYVDWGVWIEIPELSLTFYRYDFINGCSIIVETAHENYGYLEGDKGHIYRRSIDIIDPKVDPLYNTHFYGGVSAVVDWMSKHKDEI